MGKPQTLLIDIGLAAALAVALLVVFLVDRTSRRADEEFRGPPLSAEEFKVVPLSAQGGSTSQTTSKEPGKKAEAKPLRLGVTKVFGEWDLMTDLLRELGRGSKDKALPEIDPKTNTFKSIAGYETTILSNADLLSPDLRKRFDVLFLACCPINPKVDTPDVIRDTGARLRQFVEEGGTLYASDWRIEYLKPERAFREFFQPVSDIRSVHGKKGDVIAKVQDPGLREALGPEVQKTAEVRMKFDLDEWKVAAFKPDKVTTYMTGKYVGIDGITREGLLLVKFSPPRPKGATADPGTVIFTSFHNAKQSAVADKLLTYLVFHALTAKVESEGRTRIVEQGYEPIFKRQEQGFESKGSSLVSSSSDEELSLRRKYENKRRGKLLFSVTFYPQEKLEIRLRLKAPDGKVCEGKMAASFGIELTDAAKGDWEYEVTAIGLSDLSFPFTVTVSEAKVKKK
jgi:hypothetical protein